jgi:predicted dehydrogenase
MTQLRTGILGCGGFAAKHAENLNRLPDRISLVAFCDQKPERAANFARKYGNPESQVFADHHDLFKQVQLDLLVIVIPPFAHSDEVALAAERGIHLLIEKPIALSSEKAWEMVADVEKAGVITQVGFMYRFGAAVQRMKNLIESGRSGPVGLVRAGYFCNNLHAPWWREKAKSGGQIFEQAIHLIDLMRYLAGDPQTVYCIQNNLFHQNVPGYTVEDVSGTVFAFQNGGIGVLSATNNAIPWRWAWDMRLVSQSVVADFKDANHASFVFTDIKDPQPDTFLPSETISVEQDEYMLELYDLLNAIKTGAPTRTPMREGALTLDMAFAAARSGQSNSPVELTRS